MSEKPDVEIVRECLAGNTKAFEVLVARYEKPVFNVALRFISNYNDAVDVAQNSFIKAFNNLHSFDTTKHFFSWLYRIAINESLNYLKTRKQFEALGDDQTPLTPSPDDSFDRAESDATIQGALMRLNNEQRMVIVLRHFQNLTYGEIGSILNIPEKTVKSRLFSARQNLKEILLRIGMKL